MSNIYLNEFDRYIKHKLKPLGYLRYGDDWLCFLPDQSSALALRENAIQKLDELSLVINPKINRIAQVRKGVSYLGVDIWPTGHRLQLRVSKRVEVRIDAHNAASYRSLVLSHQKPKRLKEIDWRLL